MFVFFGFVMFVVFFLFGDFVVICCECVVVELCVGCLVLFYDGQGQCLVVIVLDSVIVSSFVMFVGVVCECYYLFLIVICVCVFGVEVLEGVCLLLVGIVFDILFLLGYLCEFGLMFDGWVVGDVFDVGVVELVCLGLLLLVMVVVCLDVDDYIFDGVVEVVLCDLVEGVVYVVYDYELVVCLLVLLCDVGMIIFVVFRGGVVQCDQVVIIVGELDLLVVVLVCVYFLCLIGDLFGLFKCDCGDQLWCGLCKLKELGGGVLLYLDQEGRGIGIVVKMCVYGYQYDGLDIIDVDVQLGFGVDECCYGSVVVMLYGLGILCVVLFSNNLIKVQCLCNVGIEVLDCILVIGEIIVENEYYLCIKVDCVGYLLDVDVLIQVVQ